LREFAAGRRLVVVESHDKVAHPERKVKEILDFGKDAAGKGLGMAVAERAIGLLLTPAKLRVWGWRSAISLVDQGLTSGAGFAINLLLARWVAPEVYGAFAVAFAGFLFFFGFYNVLLLEPLTVFGPSRYAEKLPTYFHSQIIVHLVLVGPLSAVALLTGFILLWVAPTSPLGGAVLGAGLTLPFLLLAWLARRLYYVVQRPALAAAGSGFYLCFVVVGLFVLGHYGWLGSFTAFLLMGCGSILASGLLLWRLGLLKYGPSEGSEVSWRSALRENWTYGRWLVGSTVLSSMSSQTQTFLAAGILGLGAAGTLRAMQLPSLVMTQVVFASGLIVLPAFSYDFGKGSMALLRHKATLASVGLVAGGLGFAALLWLFAGRAEHLLFGGKYAPYAWLMPVFALIPVAMGFSTGYSMAMRASQKPRFDLVANAIAAPVGVVSAILFMRWWGIAGAAVSMAVGFAAYAVSVCRIYYVAQTNQE
jgi:O-antigen/teichoic acid export membrane protein